MEKSHEAVSGAGIPELCVRLKTHLFSLCSRESLCPAVEIDGHLCPSTSRRNNFSPVKTHRQTMVHNCVGMDHQIPFGLSPV